jgi:probable phosphoglycerate mutase
MTGCDVYIVRHGNTFGPGDIVTRVGGRTDLPLKGRGPAQAQALASHFAGQGVQFAKVYSSPLQRTMQTAQAIAELCAVDIAIEPADFLREIDYGPDENEAEDKVIARIGEDALTAWEARSMVPDGWRVDPHALRLSWSQFLASLSGEEGPILVVTSNGVARFALDIVSGGAGALAPRKLRTGAYGQLRVGRDGVVDLISWDQRP